MVNFEEILKEFLPHSVLLDKDSVLKVMMYCYELGLKKCSESTLSLEKDNEKV